MGSAVLKAQNRAKMTVPPISTLIRHAQNTQDHHVALTWTREPTETRLHRFTAPRCSDTSQAVRTRRVRALEARAAPALAGAHPGGHAGIVAKNLAEILLGC